MPARIKYNGSPLKVNGVPAGDLSCCCDSLCDQCNAVAALPDTIYITVTWCGTSVITLTKYYDYTQPNAPAACEKRWSGSGTFGGGGGSPAFFRVSIFGDCVNGLIIARYCFDGCTTGECGNHENPSLWTEWTDFSIDPLYGTHDEPAPPSACGDGPCMDAWSLELSE